MTQASAVTWLKAAIAVNMIIGGIALAMVSHPSLAAIGNLFIDLAFWPVDGTPASEDPAARFLGGIGGGAFFGWGIALWLVVQRLMPTHPGIARSIILTGILSWWAVDSGASVLSGAYANVLLNCVILASFLIPLRAMMANGKDTGRALAG